MYSPTRNASSHIVEQPGDDVADQRLRAEQRPPKPNTPAPAIRGAVSTPSRDRTTSAARTPMTTPKAARTRGRIVWRREAGVAPSSSSAPGNPGPAPVCRCRSIASLASSQATKAASIVPIAARAGGAWPCPRPDRTYRSRRSTARRSMPPRWQDRRRERSDARCGRAARRRSARLPARRARPARPAGRRPARRTARRASPWSRGNIRGGRATGRRQKSGTAPRRARARPSPRPAPSSRALRRSSRRCCDRGSKLPPPHASATRSAPVFRRSGSR